MRSPRVAHPVRHLATVMSLPFLGRPARAVGVALAAALLGAPLAARPLAAQGAPPTPVTAADTAAVTRAALDYIEGWFTGDSARMRRAVHPSLAKRIAERDPATGRVRVDHMGADALVRATGRGGGSAMPAERRERDVRIQAIEADMASVRVLSTQFIDYLHLARTHDGWRIVNVLWTFRPDGGAAAASARRERRARPAAPSRRRSSRCSPPRRAAAPRQPVRRCRHPPRDTRCCAACTRATRAGGTRRSRSRRRPSSTCRTTRCATRRGTR
jgi:hypothetical protein